MTALDKQIYTYEYMYAKKAKHFRLGLGGLGACKNGQGTMGGGSSIGSIRPARMASTNMVLDAFVLIVPPCSLAYVLSDSLCRLKLVPTAAV